MENCRAVAVIVIVALLLAASANPVYAQRTGYDTSYSGVPVPQALKRSALLVCESNQADSTGYYTQDLLKRIADPSKNATVRLQSSFDRQSSVSRWSITINGDEASVVTTQDTTPETYRVLMRDTWGVILIALGQGVAGGAVNVLSIDPTNGSFLSVSTSVGAMWHRSTVFVGQCK